MVVILGHALIDFDVEFMAITIPLFMTLEFDKKAEVKSIMWAKAISIALTGIYCFFAVVTARIFFSPFL